MIARAVVQNVSRQLRKRVPLEGGRGFTTVDVGREFADVHVTVDLDAIARRYGERAMRNKSGISKQLKGAVIVQATNRKKVSP